jgi:UDP-N-acetylglucosamine 1-carboxyvinyltransferase
MRDAGATVITDPEVYEIRTPERLRATDVQTFPYPGFPTDLQAPFATTMTQAEGNSSIYETMYNGRLGYVTELKRLGAQIDVSGSGRMAMVHGPTPLMGADVCALDIRSGAAVVLAGLAAEGETRISNVSFVDRGYQGIEDKLRALGAHVSRTEEDGYECPEISGDAPVEWDMTPMLTQ